MSKMVEYSELFNRGIATGLGEVDLVYSHKITNKLFFCFFAKVSSSFFFCLNTVNFYKSILVYADPCFMVTETNKLIY